MYGWYGFLSRSYSSFKLIRDGAAFQGKRRNWKAGAEGLKELRVRQDQVRETLQFWVLYALLSLHELYFEFLVSWVPFYFYVKLALLWYMVNPGTRGATVVFEYFEPRLQSKVDWVESNVVPTVELWMRGAVSLAESLSHRTLESMSNEALEAYAQRLALCQEALDQERARRRIVAPLAQPPAQRRASVQDENASMVEVEVGDDDVARRGGFVVVSPQPPYSGSDGATPPMRPPRRAPPAPSSVPTPSFYPTRGIAPTRSVTHDATDQLLDELMKSPQRSGVSTLQRAGSSSSSPQRRRPVVEEIQSPMPPAKAPTALEEAAEKDMPTNENESTVASFFSAKRLSWTPRWPFSNPEAFVPPSPISPDTPLYRDAAAAPPLVGVDDLEDDGRLDALPSPTGPVTRSRARRRAKQ